jgi:hypothetical protein
MVASSERVDLSGRVEDQWAFARPLVVVPEENSGEVSPGEECPTDLIPHSGELAAGAEGQGETRVDQVRTGKAQLFHRGAANRQRPTKARGDASAQELEGLGLSIGRHDPPAPTEELEGVRAGAASYLDRNPPAPVLPLGLELLERA